MSSPFKYRKRTSLGNNSYRTVTSNRVGSTTRIPGTGFTVNERGISKRPIRVSDGLYISQSKPKKRRARLEGAKPMGGGKRTTAMKNEGSFIGTGILLVGLFLLGAGLYVIGLIERLWAIL